MPVDLHPDGDYISLADGTIVGHTTIAAEPLLNPSTCTGKYGQVGWTYGMAGKTYGGCDFISPPSVVTGGVASTEDLLDLTGNVNQRIDCFRFEVIDAAHNLLGYVHPKRAQHASQIGMDTTRTLFRSMTNFELDPNQQDDLNTNQDRIRPVLILQNGAEFSLGVFLFADATRPRRSWGLELSASLIDERYILDQSVGRNIGLAAGVNVINSAVNIVQEVCMCPMSVVGSGVTLAQPLGWKVSDRRLQIVEDLCALAGYLPPYFDNHGTLVFRPTPAPPFSALIPPYETDTRIVKDSIIETDELLHAPNRYIAIDQGATDTPRFGVYDIPGSAPNSVANRGFPVVQTLTMQGLLSNSAAVQAAQAFANHDPNQFGQAEFDSTLDPRHDTFDIVTFLGHTYREIAWSIELRSGAPMHHKIRRVFN